MPANLPQGRRFGAVATISPRSGPVFPRSCPGRAPPARSNPSPEREGPMTPEISEVPEKRKLRDSVLFKMIVTGMLILALGIPLAMVRSQIRERQSRRDSVVAEVAGVWGRDQTLGGPVLTVPYLLHSKDEKGKVTTWTQLAHFLPETLKVDGRLLPELRRRGIFEVAVYRADLHASGHFQRPSFTEWGIPPQDILWDKAWLSIGVPDMRGIRR